MLNALMKPFRKKSLEGEKKVLKHENTRLLKCKADLTTDPLKDLTLKMVMRHEKKFTVMRDQKRHANAYMKKYERQLRGPKRVVDFKRHPNPMSKWAKMRKLLADENKIEKLKGNTLKCVNGYNLAELFKELKIEHKGQCEMEATYYHRLVLEAEAGSTAPCFDGPQLL